MYKNANISNTNFPLNAIFRLPHPQSGDSQDQETILAPSADNKIRNYDRVLKPPSCPINTKVKGIEPYQDEMVSCKSKFTSKCQPYICIHNIYIYVSYIYVDIYISFIYIHIIYPLADRHHIDTVTESKNC